MSWRIVNISGRAKLDFKLNYLVVRKEETVKIHISEVAILIIESTMVSLTTALLSELSKNKVKVIFCDEKHNPSSELFSYYNKHNSSLMLKEQISWTLESKNKVWEEIVKNKIKIQAKVLEHYSFDSYKLLQKYIEQVASGDSSNREGHAAKVYFNSLFSKDFSRKNESPINAALNYGYGILLSMFNREIVSNGYITQLGIFHDNQFNHFNLACDLMEPFRPFVDNIVIKLFPEEFNKEIKVEILNGLLGKVFLKKKNYTLLNAVSVYSKSVFKVLRDKNIGAYIEVDYEL